MKTPERIPLYTRMRARADADGLPHDHEIRALATDLEEAVAGNQAHPQMVGVERLVGTWAKTRKVWCAYTGEGLV